MIQYNIITQYKDGGYTVKVTKLQQDRWGDLQAVDYKDGEDIYASKALAEHIGKKLIKELL